MAEKQTLHKLNYIRTTSNMLVFNVSVSNRENANDNVTYLANIERYDGNIDSTQSPNKFCIKDDKNVIHNIYNVKTTLFHHLAARRHAYPYESLYDYLHIYKSITDTAGNISPLSIINTILSYNTLYSLLDMTTNGHYYVNDKLYSYLCRDSAYAFPNTHSIDTLLYNRNELSNGLSSTVSTVLSGVKYNVVYEIPGNILQCYKDGSIYATTFKTKSLYTAAYSMEHDNDNLQSKLINARRYFEICNCNNQVYLKYDDTLTYVANGELQTSFASTAKFLKVKEGNNIQPTRGCNNIPLIEVIKNINRGINCNKHKSTLYSINISTTKILADDCWKNVPHSKEIKENIKREIKNYVRALTSRIAPANTLLFAITVN